ncbi:MAG: STAS domain-containing protein [Limnochordia bacterium]|jgi:anti-anti-sigma regulatory factor
MAVYKLPADFTIYNVEEVWRDLKAVADGELTIDASEVRDLDGAAVQLLVSTYKTVPHLRLTNPSEEFRLLVSLAGWNLEAVGVDANEDSDDRR